MSRSCTLSMNNRRLLARAERWMIYQFARACRRRDSAVLAAPSQPSPCAGAVASEAFPQCARHWRSNMALKLGLRAAPVDGGLPSGATRQIDLLPEHQATSHSLYSAFRIPHSAFFVSLLLWCGVVALPPAMAAPDREPVTLSVVTVNPSADKTHTVPVRIDLPAEITPGDVLDTGALKLEFDDARSIYYVYREKVELAPKETKVFEVMIRDVWFVADDQLASLRNYTQTVFGRLEGTEYYEPGQQLGQSILRRLDQIAAIQNDETLSRKSRIGAYRIHLRMIDEIKEDLARMEKLLTFTGGPPVPEMLEESPLKSDAPSTTTTWLVIFLVVIFVGLLGAQFFFTWHRRTQVTQELDVVRRQAFGSSTRSKGGSAPPERPGGS